MSDVFTIGHSNHAASAFLTLLRQHGVHAVADVRSAPYSRFNPQFRREALRRELMAASIAYVYLGGELGGRSDDPTCYREGRICYERVAKTQNFNDGLQRLEEGMAKHRIALMCAEKEPLHCHRTLLVAQALDERGVAVSHIHADGRLESHCDAMDRLLDAARLPAADDLLAQSRADLVAAAIRWQTVRRHTGQSRPATRRRRLPPDNAQPRRTRGVPAQIDLALWRP